MRRTVYSRFCRKVEVKRAIAGFELWPAGGQGFSLMRGASKLIFGVLKKPLGKLGFEYGPDLILSTVPKDLCPEFEQIETLKTESPQTQNRVSSKQGFPQFEYSNSSSSFSGFSFLFIRIAFVLNFGANSWLARRSTRCSGRKILK